MNFQEQVYFQLWRPLEERLGDSLTEFLRHYITRDGEEPNRGGIYAAIKAKFGHLGGEELKKELARLVRHSQYYSSFLHPDQEHDASIIERLRAIQELFVTTAFPLMLRLFDYREDGLLDDSSLERALGVIESFLLRRAVCAVPTNALNKLFAQWARNVPNTDVVGWLRTEVAKGEGSRRCPKDDEFLQKLQYEDLYRRKGTRYLLVRLERSFNSPEPASLDLATIEHLMPQTLSDVWRAYLGAEADRIHLEYCHTLGNLTLSATNSELGNMPFDEKKTILAGSHIDLNKGIVQKAVWGEAEIVDRGRLLAERVRSLWPQP